MSGSRNPGGIRQFTRNLWSGSDPLPRRLLVTALNLARRGRRFPPADCCGHYGEPGC